MKKFTISLMIIAMAIVAMVATGMALPIKEDEISSLVGSAYLVDSQSGKVLYEYNADERKPIASMVKIMTLLLTFEAIDSGKIATTDNIVISHEAAKQIGSELFIDEGATYTLSDLIKGVVVVSANDASVAIAERLACSEDAFVNLMNEKADAIGLKDTRFSNCTGYPSQSEQYSTARDVSVMTRELLKHKVYYDYSKIWLEDYNHPSGRVTQLANTNKLIRHYKGCDSGKTGYTDSAKFCLSASATRDNMRVVATVLGASDSKSRFKAVGQMFNLAFNNYQSKVLLHSGQAIDTPVKIARAKEKQIFPIVTQDITALITRSTKEWKVEYQLDDNLKAPMMQGSQVGTAIVYIDGVESGRYPIVLAKDIEKATIWDYVKGIGEKF